MLRVIGFIAFILAIPCLANSKESAAAVLVSEEVEVHKGSSNRNVLSLNEEKRKRADARKMEKLRSQLYALWDLEMKGQQEADANDPNGSEEQEADVNDFNGSEEQEEADVNGSGESGMQLRSSSPDTYYTWRAIFHVKNNPYLKELFLIDLRLFDWIEESPEPLYAAISSGNLDMIKFFAEYGKISLIREGAKFGPLQFSIIAQKPAIEGFFLNHPATDFNQKSVWGDNLFHSVFLGFHKVRVTRSQLLELLLHPDHFPKVEHLLNIPNDSNETVLDSAYNDNSPDRERNIGLLREKGALRFGELPESEKTEYQKRNQQRIQAIEESIERLALEKEEKFKREQARHRAQLSSCEGAVQGVRREAMVEIVSIQ